MTCTRCGGCGFLSSDLIPEELIAIDDIETWMKTDDGQISGVVRCDCCGDGSQWYGTPGEHYGSDDPPGMNGPYRYNGGLCECN